ncbi:MULTISPECIES: hypothetical protein [Microbacterium]|uniref:Uncharacterized protein n=1 Tax=Microbacterium wangchenii TaxID=2541726 RepID=A0ABX5SZ30_9MICO|nr:MULTISPECIES: hypothetical protein [Microbacterium]MCK6065764.1 hypothetical protein [Microbacterium sp. EYE_512]QBR90080.1 hypothetical protein E4K62_16160 [Microbacterium wangchenii]
MTSGVGAAYSTRAAEYVEKIGSIATMHPPDLALITSWAAPRRQADGRHRLATLVQRARTH